MTKNIGAADKVVRIIIATIIAAFYLSHIISGATATILLILATILMVTGFISFCPLYLPFGISTKKK